MKDWLKIAKSLDCGRSTRIKCYIASCTGLGKARLVSHNEKGYSTHCFRCGESDYRPHGVRTIKEMLEHRKQLDKYIAEQGDVRLPSDFTDDVPPHACAWFLKAGIAVSVAKSYNIGWSPSMNRVILPVTAPNGSLEAVQCRAVHKDQQPKYLNRAGGKKGGILFHSNPDLLRDDLAPNWFVITEDILSAIRVGRYCSAISTLGTTFHTKAMLPYLQSGSGVILWYDGDQAGVKGMAKAKKELDLLGIPCKMIKTELDPKGYSDDEIQQIIGWEIQDVLSQPNTKWNPGQPSVSET